MSFSWFFSPIIQTSRGEERELNTARTQCLHKASRRARASSDGIQFIPRFAFFSRSKIRLSTASDDDTRYSLTLFTRLVDGRCRTWRDIAHETEKKSARLTQRASSAESAVENDAECDDQYLHVLCGARLISSLCFANCFSLSTVRGRRSSRRESIEQDTLPLSQGVHSSSRVERDRVSDSIATLDREDVKVSSCARTVTCIARSLAPR